jgi:glyoxylase-like metal-dependent hydrolase (beta-lactamase superfamily II)
MFTVPASCPFTIQDIQLNGIAKSNTYLIRERDAYGEFPHIYAKICSAPRSASSPNTYAYRNYSYSRYLNGCDFENKPEASCKVIVLSDTGCGTEVPNTSFSEYGGREGQYSPRAQPEVWNIRTFLEYTINPGGRIPYLVMTTHCHYDHIMGIAKLLSASTSTTVLTSSHAKPFISPYANLQKHSLCNTLNLNAPKYDVGIWADDFSHVAYTPTSGPSPVSMGATILTPFTILHTPGHTPDSLSWYDSHLRLLCVGDSFYAKESSTTREAKWGSEPAMAVIFNLESDLKDWWMSLDKVLQFVRVRNREVGGDAESESDKDIGEQSRPPMDGHQSDGGKNDDGEIEDEGFVLVDVDNATSDTDDGSSLATKAKQLCLAPTASTAAAAKPAPVVKLQKQTGFDIPPPSQRMLAAYATTSRNSLLTPTILPTATPLRPGSPPDILAFNFNKLNPDPWMLVINRDKPLPFSLLRKSPPPPLVGGVPSWNQPTHTLDSSAAPLQPQSRPALTPNTTARPRVKLCAAHTTLSLDAEHALISMRGFLLRVLKDEVPCQRVEDGSRGEEQWLWDFAIPASEDARRILPLPCSWPWGNTLDGPTRETRTEAPRACGKAETGTEMQMQMRKQRQMELEGQGRARARGQGSQDRAMHAYSVLAPLSVIEEGRRQILGQMNGSTRSPAGVV